MGTRPERFASAAPLAVFLLRKAYTALEAGDIEEAERRSRTAQKGGAAEHDLWELNREISVATSLRDDPDAAYKEDKELGF